MAGEYKTVDRKGVTFVETFNVGRSTESGYVLFEFDGQVFGLPALRAEDLLKRGREQLDLIYGDATHTRQ